MDSKFLPVNDKVFHTNYLSDFFLESRSISLEKPYTCSTNYLPRGDEVENEENSFSDGVRRITAVINRMRHV